MPRSATGYVEANAMILAGNAYSLLEPKHLSGLVFPAGTYIIGTEPLTEGVANSRKSELISSGAV